MVYLPQENWPARQAFFLLTILDYLFLHLIYKYQKEGRGYFSMGTVTEKNELGYNPGLKKQKEELGCRIYNQKILNLNLT